VRAKPLALKRAIGNLVDNALFYGERAEIAVRALDGWIEIAVRDHGPGVPEAAFASLLEPYVRLSHGRERNDGGMGLGLGIAAGIIEGHGGELVLANHPEGGLNAVIRLPG
jgi:signal transduction histidine kinase